VRQGDFFAIQLLEMGLDILLHWTDARIHILGSQLACHAPGLARFPVRAPAGTGQRDLARAVGQFCFLPAVFRTRRGILVPWLCPVSIKHGVWGPFHFWGVPWG